MSILKFFIYTCLSVGFASNLCHSAQDTELEAILDLNRSILHHESKHEIALSNLEFNKTQLAKIKEELTNISNAIQKIDLRISQNQKGTQHFPELSEIYNKDTQALKSEELGLLSKQKQLEHSKSTLIDINRKLSNLDKELIYSLDLLKQTLMLKRDKHLKSLTAKTIEKSGHTQIVTDTFKDTCSFIEIYGKQQGNKHACMEKVIARAKKSIAEKYAPTTISSEVLTQNFQITSENSSQYYSVNVSILQEFKKDSWLKMEAESERFKVQFKGEFRISPAFTEKAQKTILKRFTHNLEAKEKEIITLERKRQNSIPIAKNNGLSVEQKAKAAFQQLRQEINTLKNTQAINHI